jgi:flavin-dependent dehydrogenase
MYHSDLAAARSGAVPVILGAGLTGLAISRALAQAGVRHVLVGDRVTAAPRLGESLNAEGSLEVVRQFPELRRFLFPKRRQALLFGDQAVAFDSWPGTAGRWFDGWLGYPATVPLWHVDRVGFDRALYELVIADEACTVVEDRAVGLDYHRGTDRIAAVHLAGGQTLASTYVFDATNHLRVVARQLGVPCTVLGEERRVVFAHCRAAAPGRMPAPPWKTSTVLLRLDRRQDPVEGLAWCIPLGDYVSVGVSVDPAGTVAPAARLLDWVDQAYARRGVRVREAFPERGTPVDLRHEHYDHERCHGGNWLLAGPTCCQFWFPSAAGVATGLVAARLAPDVLRAPARVPRRYQAYLDQVAGSHARLEWLVRDAPGSVTGAELRQRAQGLIGGNVRRLGFYLELEARPSELAYGDAFRRMYESDRRLANPLRIEAAPLAAQATRLFV